MRRNLLSAVCLAVLCQAPAVTPALSAAPGYAQAKAVFDNGFTVPQRIRIQLLLIAAGYNTAVPTEHFNVHAFDGLRSFEAAHGFSPNGQLDGVEIDRLNAEGGAKLNLWGFRQVTHPNRNITIWVPLGLGLDGKVNGSGLHYKDPQGRLNLDFVSVSNRGIADVFRGLMGGRQRDGSEIHYHAEKDSEGWFVISSTSPDGHDHYYRYHQDGSAVTGFALEWNNAAGNINAERIAVIMSGSLGSAMSGAPFIDPPDAQGQAKAEVPAPQPAAVPIPPPQKPEKKEGFSSGTGFFVSDLGHMITNAHVVEGCSKVLVKGDDGAVKEAQRLASDAANDLALLKVDMVPARVAELRTSMRLGENVEAFGFPHSDILSTSGNFTLGNVTAMTGMRDDIRYLQISAPVQAGNSGGPLLDNAGNLVGVVSAKLDAIKVMLASDDLPQNVNFAVKSAMVAQFLDANRVAYQTGAPGGKALEPADLADRARGMSAFVVCR